MRKGNKKASHLAPRCYLAARLPDGFRCLVEQLCRDWGEAVEDYETRGHGSFTSNENGSMMC